MRGEGETIEANSAKTSGQESDEVSGSATDDDAPTDGCRMVQEAVREFGKKKKAADQSKKAGSTRKDAHPGDNHGMMSQGNRKGKRSGYTVQRTVSTTVRTQGDAVPQSRARARLFCPQETFWSPARTYSGARRNYPDPTTPVPDYAEQECAIQTMASDSDRPNEATTSCGSPPHCPRTRR